jgi:two-component system cell cycle response regulator
MTIHAWRHCAWKLAAAFAVPAARATRLHYGARGSWRSDPGIDLEVRARMPHIGEVLALLGDARLRAQVAQALSGGGFAVQVAEDSGGFALVTAEEQPDLLILDPTTADRVLGDDRVVLHDERVDGRPEVLLLAPTESAAAAPLAGQVRVDDWLDLPISDEVLLARVRPLARLATIGAEVGRRQATARGLGSTLPVLAPTAAAALRVLIVTGNDDVVQRVAATLSADCETSVEADPYRAADAVVQQSFDAVVIGVDGPEAGGRSLSLASQIRNNPSLFDLPVLVLHTAAAFDDPALPYRHGASIVLPMPMDAARLRIAFDHLIRRRRRYRRLREAMQQTYLPELVALQTPVYRQIFLEAYLDRLVPEQLAHNRHLTVALFTLTNLAEVERQYFTDAAERFLVMVAGWIAGVVRQEDLVARVDRDSFCVVLPDTPRVEAYQVIDRVAGILHQSDFSLSEEITEPVKAQVRRGGATLTAGDTPESLLARAVEDQA